MLKASYVVDEQFCKQFLCKIFNTNNKIDIHKHNTLYYNTYLYCSKFLLLKYT